MSSLSKTRQPKLFATAGPWRDRFGAGFFKGLPPGAGVYFFRDAGGQLLYIGQSKCLRARIGSYRHVDPDRHARRTLRLIQKTFRIEWETCEDAAAAVAREARLLLEHRPPYNRAGVWLPPDCGFRLRIENGRLELELTAAPDSSAAITADAEVVGPLPGSLRRAFAPLVRCLFRAMHPSAAWWAYPAGLLSAQCGTSAGWLLPAGYETPLADFRAFLESGAATGPGLLAATEKAAGANGFEADFWDQQAEAISSYQKAFLKRLSKNSCERRADKGLKP